MERVLATVHEVLDDLKAHEDRALVEAEEVETSPLARLDTDEEMPTSVPERWQQPGAVLCLPGSGKLDEAAAVILAQIMNRRGIGAAAETSDALSMSRFFSLDLSSAAAFCICYVGKPSDAMIQYTVRRLSKKARAAASSSRSSAARATR